MKLLVVTQAVAQHDPVLGFFHEWLREFAKRAEAVEAICLYEGTHALPENVRVRSLGKERGNAGRVRYALRFLKLIRGASYDAVFVHMNEEYVLLGGLYWRLTGRRVLLWRNHAQGTWRTHLACLLAHRVLHTSPEAFVARHQKAACMPAGIDTRTFVPQGDAEPDTALLLGRVDAVKRLPLAFDALELLSTRGARVRCDVYGEPTPGREAYARELRERYRPLEEAGVVRYCGAISHEKTPPLYASHGVYVNATASGSFDKTIGEAMACGALVVCTNTALREIVSAPYLAADTAASVADGIRVALALPPDERRTLTGRYRRYIEERHSLDALMARLMPMLAA